MNKLYVTVGVPGSGKSTWIANQNWSKDCVIVSTDTHVEAHAKANGKSYSEVFEEFIPEAIGLMFNDVIDAKDEGKDIIWDQTSTSIKTRAKKIRMLPNYYKIAVVFSKPGDKELKRRLASRPGKDVPWSVIEQTWGSWEDPTKEEGFDEIWYV